MGLITNQTGLDRSGERTIDLLHKAEGVDLVAIFSPEHGPQGNLDRPGIADDHDSPTGLPIYSLYGKTLRPTEAMLHGIDTLVYDIQDVGVRFYTYTTTLGYCMEEAARHGLRFVVLDRPNPIGGLAVEGPMLDAGRESFVAYDRRPVRHGMTVGELAALSRRTKNAAGPGNCTYGRLAASDLVRRHGPEVDKPLAQHSQPDRIATLSGHWPAGANKHVSRPRHAVAF